MPDAIPDDWNEPPWTRQFNRSELAWLCSVQHERNTRLQIQLRELRAKTQQEQT